MVGNPTAFGTRSIVNERLPVKCQVIRECGYSLKNQGISPSLCDFECSRTQSENRRCANERLKGLVRVGEAHHAPIPLSKRLESFQRKPVLLDRPSPDGIAIREWL